MAHKNNCTYFTFKLYVTCGPNQNCIYFSHLRHCDPVYPSRQPLLHIPLTWSHGSFFTQLPLQRSLQPIPKYPGLHSIERMICNSYPFLMGRKNSEIEKKSLFEILQLLYNLTW